MSRNAAKGIAGSKPRAKAPQKKVRLVKVVCQAFYVVDDGTNLEEQASQQLIVPASEWRDFPEQLEAQRKDTEKQLNEGS